MPDVYEQVTSRILAALDNGVAPWRVPWSGQSMVPRNVAERPYRGVNVWLTALAQYERGFSDPRWLTFKQARDLGGHVKKGEKATTVVFWRMLQKKQTDDDGKTTERSIPFARAYNVFNVEQCEGLVGLERPTIEHHEHAPHEHAERIIQGTGADIRASTTGQNFYSPSTDTIHLVQRSRFSTPAEYYATAFHELTHWTGHESRLARLGPSACRATEELVAELGGAYLVQRCGIETPEQFENAAAYCQGWADRIRADRRVFVTASGRAQRAADYIEAGQTARTQIAA